MIEVTKINGVKVLINPDLMELVEETPDTVISFTTGRKIIVKESRQEVKNLVKSYRKGYFLRIDAEMWVKIRGYSISFRISIVWSRICIWYYFQRWRGCIW